MRKEKLRTAILLFMMRKIPESPIFHKLEIFPKTDDNEPLFPMSGESFCQLRNDLLFAGDTSLEIHSAVLCGVECPGSRF